MRITTTFSTILIAGTLASGPAQGAAVIINTAGAAVALDSTSGAILETFGSGASYGGITISPTGVAQWYSEWSSVIANRAPNGSVPTISIDGRVRDIGYDSNGTLYATKTATANSSFSGLLRYDPGTGASIEQFISIGGTCVSGVPCSFPGSFTIGPNGNIFVNNIYQSLGSEILQFNGATGSSIGTFVPLNSSGLGSIFDLEFGSDGYLYASTNSVSTGGATGIARFDGATGEFIDLFIDGAAWNLNQVTGFTFGEDGDIFLISGAELFRFNASGQLVASLRNQMGYQGYFIEYVRDFNNVHSVPEAPTLALMSIAFCGVFLSRRNLARKALVAS